MAELPLDDEGMHRYLRVYYYYRELILTGRLEAGSRLPSIRKCAAQLALSRTTVENAYMMLAAEGYITSRPQSGFYVAEFLGGRGEQRQTEEERREKKEIRFDFASSGVDRDRFQFGLWRRYIKSALRQDERLLSYGEPQGERELREELCGYLARHRNVVCTPDQIVIGAGIQSLLHVLCPMVRGRSTAVLYNPSFKQGRTVFEDYGFDLEAYRKEEEEEKGKEKGEGGHLPFGSLLYITPSQMTTWGEVMHIAERMALIKDAFERDVLIIEDDYNSEFRYYNRPIPSLQGLAGGKNVVYLGTFSRLLLPSIRMSYMVLPPELLPLYRARGGAYNQTASKAEQIALCQFIRDGHLESQIRKTRKLYTAKAKRLCEEIERVFGERARGYLGEAGFLVLVQIETELTAGEITARAEQAGLAVRPVRGPATDETIGEAGGTIRGAGDSKDDRPEGGKVRRCEVGLFSSASDRLSYLTPRILLSCSNVPPEQYEEALTRLRDAIFA